MYNRPRRKREIRTDVSEVCHPERSRRGGATSLRVVMGKAGAPSLRLLQGREPRFHPAAAVIGKNLEGTPWTSGPVDVVTNGIVNRVGSLITGSGDTVQTLNDATELGSVLSDTGEVAEYATGFGEIKLGYDALTYAGGLAGCYFGILN